jgi:Uma2 family endonuclease
MTGYPLNQQDLLDLQAHIPDHRLELVHGDIVVMSPSGYNSDEVAANVVGGIHNWVKPRKLGRVTASSAGFTLPNSDIRSPDVSFVKAERLRISPESFAPLAPDIAVEVKSPTDTIEKLREKLDSFLEQGTTVGILIHPQQKWVEVRRLNQEAIILKGTDVLTVEDVLPGWELPLEEIWAPEF